MGRPVRLLLLQTGEAIDAVVRARGGFHPLFEAALAGSETLELVPFDITTKAEADPLPVLDDFHGAVMTGSPAMVGEDTPWMRYGARLIRHLLDVQLPFLGVCFGHQLLGVATGCDVGPNPRGRELGTVAVEVDASDDPLLSCLPARFTANVSHVDVIRTPAPPLKVMGRALHDPCHVVKAGPWAWGVQFHPEFDEEVTRLYLETRRDLVDRERGAGAAEARLAALSKTPEARSLLARFTALCQARAELYDVARFVTKTDADVDEEVLDVA